MIANDRDMDSGDLLESAEQEAFEILEGLSEREECNLKFIIPLPMSKAYKFVYGNGAAHSK